MFTTFYCTEIMSRAGSPAYCPRVFYTTQVQAPHANTPDRQGRPIRRQAAGEGQRHQGGRRRDQRHPEACAAAVGRIQQDRFDPCPAACRTAGRSPTVRRGSQYGIRRSRTQAGGCATDSQEASEGRTRYKLLSRIPEA